MRPDHPVHRASIWSMIGHALSAVLFFMVYIILFVAFMAIGALVFYYVLTATVGVVLDWLQ